MRVIRKIGQKNAKENDMAKKSNSQWNNNEDKTQGV